MIDFCIYIIIGMASGFLNTIGGGGTFVVLPILIFMGMPASVANATARVGILVQNIFAVGGFHSKGVKLPFPYTIYLCLASLTGGFIGAQIAVRVPDDIFKKIIAVLMIFIVISIVFEKKKGQIITDELLSPTRQLIGVSCFFLLGIYGGFIQAGIGYLVIALLTQLHHYSLAKTNYLKVFVAILYTAVAVGTFAMADIIEWKAGLMIAVGQGISAWYTSRWSVAANEKWIKRILAVSAVGLAVKLWFS